MLGTLGLERRVTSTGLRRPWVAKLTGLDDTYGFDREFVEAKVDYIDANAKGTRGVKLWYLLGQGAPYEVCEWVSKNRSKRYFVKIDDGGSLVECTRQEVETWLKS